MIRGMENGPEAFFEATYEVMVDEIRKNLHPRIAPTTRKTFEAFVDLLEYRALRHAMHSLEDRICTKEADAAYVRALNELRDEISRWLELPQEQVNG